ncbi:PSK domain-containing protein, partial [Cephalotus follicularis]
MANMTTKFTTLFILALFLCSTLTYAARPEPASPTKTQQVERGEMVESESCEGVAEEECLMRRTLAAHLDYIYTQKH